jgi:hypothetical protein
MPRRRAAGARSGGASARLVATSRARPVAPCGFLRELVVVQVVALALGVGARTRPASSTRTLSCARGAVSRLSRRRAPTWPASRAPSRLLSALAERRVLLAGVSGFLSVLGVVLLVRRASSGLREGRGRAAHGLDVDPGRRARRRRSRGRPCRPIWIARRRRRRMQGPP